MWEESSSAASSSSKKSANTKILLYVGVGIVILLLIGVAGYFYFQYQNAQKLIAGNATAQQVQGVIDRVGKVVELPKDEKPTLASVTDKFKLNNQPFFAKAENGDQVLIYTKNKTAILYRPSTNKIINYATGVTIGQANPVPTTAQEVSGATSAPQEEVVPTVVLRPTTVPTKRPAALPTVEPSPTATQ